MASRRIGLIGFGHIGRYVYEQITRHTAPGLALAFVYNRTPDKLADLPAALVLDDLDDMAKREADLVVEMAHPTISQRYGAHILSHTDYLMLSVSALADEPLEQTLLTTTRMHGTRLYIPHGALIGVDNLFESRTVWERVTITFRKHPASIDFSQVDITPQTIDRETVLYDGPVRGIASLYPRNINTMLTCALATVGMDRCRGVLIADPTLDVGIAEVDAKGRDGSCLRTYKSVPMVGVSGNEMPASLWNSILKAAGHQPGLQFV